MILMKTIGERIKHARIEKELTLRIADALDVSREWLIVGKHQSVDKEVIPIARERKIEITVSDLAQRLGSVYEDAYYFEGFCDGKYQDREPGKPDHINPPMPSISDTIHERKSIC